MSVPVLIVTPPFCNIGFPALGPSTLVAMCRARGIAASVFYANIELAARVGFSVYQRVSASSIHALLGEAIFQRTAFADAEGDEAHRRAVTAILSDQVDLSCGDRTSVSVEEALSCVDRVEPFLDACVREILSKQPKIVGFSSVFQQNLASIAIARRLKQIAPEVVTVLGGGNASQPMGAAIADATQAFDFIFSGEADFAFPQFCEDFLVRGELPRGRLIECEPVFDLDRVAVPEYLDYFAQLETNLGRGALSMEHRSFSLVELPYWLPIETSRGCWYGAKKHCTFCGLNGLEIKYRRKSSARTVREFQTLAASHDIPRFQASDNIMPRDFTKDVLPELASSPSRLEIFYEVKANLTEDDLDQFVLAGVTNIQPGIESLSSNVLRHMEKGVTAVQNLRLLRDCSSRNVHVSWNLLTGVPGETASDYEAIVAVLPSIEHLQPPYGHGVLRIDRFSPYHSTPERFGIVGVAPFPAYERLYPRGTRLMDLAYHFVGAYSTEYLDDEDLRSRVAAALRLWQTRWSEPRARPLLRAESLPSGEMRIEDSRAIAVAPTHTLSPADAAALLELEAPRHRDKIGPELRASLELLLGSRLVVEHEGYYLSVVTRPSIGVELRRRWSRRAWAAPRAPSATSGAHQQPRTRG